MSKKRKRKQSDSEYAADKCDDLAKTVHKDKMKKQKVKSDSVTCVLKSTKPSLQVETKPLQLIFKAADSKKRLIYFKYPDELQLIKLNETHMQQINKSIEVMLRTHPEYQVPLKRNFIKKSQSDEQDKRTTVKESPKPKLIRKLMLFGLNEIVRKIPTGQIAFVLLLDPLTTHLQKVMLEIAFTHQVPVAFAQTLNGICDLFHLSTAMCVAFTKEAGHDDSVLKSTLDQLTQMYQQQRQTITSSEMPSSASSIANKMSNDCAPKSTSKTKQKTKKRTKIDFKIPLPEFVYNLKCEHKFDFNLKRDFVDRKLNSNSLGLFTSVSSAKDDYFPPRSFYAPFVK